MDNLKGLILAFSLLSLTSACEESTNTNSPTTPAASVAESSQVDLPPLANGVIDIAGCWRPSRADGLFSTGPAFYFFRIEPNAFVLGKDAKTKFVVDRIGNLSEINRDPEKPFFPPGFVISSGTVNAENTAIGRSFPGDSKQRTYRRCQLVQSAPPEAPVIFDGVRPGSESPTPVPTVTPLQINPPQSPQAAPVADPPEPTPSAISPPAPIPEPTPTPRPTPAPTATPQPLLTPLVIASKTPPPATATPEPDPGASTDPNSTP